MSTQAKPLLRTSSIWTVLGRAVWLLLFLIHIVPFWTVGVRFITQPSLSGAGALVILIGVMALAALKAIDVSWLRFRLSPSGWCAFVLIGLLVHGEVVNKNLPDYLVVETTITLAITVCIVRRRVLKQIEQSFANFCTQLIRAHLDLIRASLPALTPQLVVACVPRRGPPRC